MIDGLFQNNVFDLTCIMTGFYASTFAIIITYKFSIWWDKQIENLKNK